MDENIQNYTIVTGKIDAGKSYIGYEAKVEVKRENTEEAMAEWKKRVIEATDFMKSRATQLQG